MTPAWLAPCSLAVPAPAVSTPGRVCNRSALPRPRSPPAVLTVTPAWLAPCSLAVPALAVPTPAVSVTAVLSFHTGSTA